MVSTLASLGEYVRGTLGARALKQPISALSTRQWLRSASPKTAKTAVDEGVQLFSATLGPQDLLFLPAGAIRHEKVMAEDD